MDEVMTNFVKFELLKSSVNIQDNTNDSKLREISVEANQEMDMQIKPYANQIPLETGSIIFGQIAKVGIHYARMIWFNHLKQHDLEKKESELYDKKIEILKLALKAERNSRTRTVFVTDDPRRKNLLLPSQKTKAIFDNF